MVTPTSKHKKPARGKQLEAPTPQRTRKRKKAARGKQPEAPTPQTPSRPSVFARLKLSEPPALQLMPLQIAWPHLLLVFAALLAVYGYTAPRTVVLEDDGEFIMAAYLLGVAHPPGYPLYVLLTHTFTWLPVGSVAWRVHLASGFFAAASCSVLWWIVRGLIPRKTVAYVAALSFGFSRAFWSQAIIAEVYTLNVLLFLLLLAFSLAYLRAQRPVLLGIIALLLGLALTNHWPLIVLASPCLVFILWPEHKLILQQLPRASLRILPLFVLGLSPYAWMVLRSQSAPELTFYGALESWQDVKSYINRSGYSGIDASPTAGWWDKLQFSGFMFREVIQQYTPVGAVLAGIGVIVQWRYWKLSFGLGLLAGFLGATFGLILLLGFDYEYIKRAIFKVYPLIPYAIMALWLALGLDRILSRLRSWNASVGRVSAVVIGGCLVLACLSLNLKYNDRRDYDFARDYGLSLLASFEPNATVFTHVDIDSTILGYFHTVEGVRPDIRLLNTQGLGITPEGRLFSPHKLSPTKWEELRKERILDYVTANNDPTYFLFDAPQSISDENFGFYKKINKSRENTSTFRVDENLLALFRRIESYSDLTDEWTVRTKGILISRITPVLSALVYLQPNPWFADKYGNDLELASNNFLGMLLRISLVEKEGGATSEQLLDWVERGERLVDDTVSKKDHANLYLLKGRILKRMGRKKDAVQAFNQSINIYPHPENKAVVYRQMK